MADYQIMVTGLWGMDTEDVYEEGEVGRGNDFDDYARMTGERFDSIDKLMEFMEKKYDIPADRGNYNPYEDGRIDVMGMVDEGGTLPSEQEISEWRNGRKKLYSRYIQLSIELVRPSIPTVEEMNDLIGESKY